MSQSLDILQLTAPAAVGGLEEVVLGLSTGLVRRGHRVTILAATGGVPDHLFARTAAERNLDLIIAPPGYAGEVRFLHRLVQSRRVQVVHSHGYRSDVLAALSATLWFSPLVSTVHGFTGGDLKIRLYEAVQCRALRRFDMVVPVSAPLRNLLVRKSVSPERLRVIPNSRENPGVLPRSEARNRLGILGEAAVIGWVGRMSWEKGADIALHALSRLERIDWTAVFIGEGPQLSALRDLSARLGLDSRIRWLGQVPGAARLFSAFSLFLQSSRTEGTPIVLLEAMAAGVPIVATSVGGVPDLLGNGEAGWLVASEDSIALGQAISAALGDTGAAAGKARQGTARLRTQHDPDRWINAYVDVYREVLAGRNR